MLIISQVDAKIRKNHHEYIEELHKETDSAYVAEIRRRREQYLLPLYNLKKEN